MTVAEFCGSINYSVAQFSVQLSKEVEEKIRRRTLFYREQIIRYIKQRIDQFTNTMQLSPAILSVYRREILHHVLFKVKPIMNKYHVFQVIK
ncbi:hypothetical protein [Bacillus xiapuensis]|uniref:hypothetical protein n=1 Tax=Bacillus xiapuensis TaxID=2014075 RepID=UPI000C24BC4F|nr:hypothetical protein [Bacillus xiapuensis]